MILVLAVLKHSASNIDVPSSPSIDFAWDIVENVSKISNLLRLTFPSKKANLDECCGNQFMKFDPMLFGW